MAKTVKDITSFEGGMVNAIEPSDSGEDATGSYESINTDGIQKKGVLRPSGSFKAFSPTINLIHNTTSTTGTGFYIWQQAFNFDTANFVASCTFNATSSSDYTISGGSGTLTDEGSYLLWKGINKQYGYFVLKSGAFESGFSAPWEDGALYKYMLNSDPDRGTVNTLAANWIALDKECYDEAWGVDTVPSDYQYEQRVGYFISNGTYPKFSMISNENDTLSSGVKLYSLKIYKEIISGSHEYQFINRKSGGLNRVDVYMDGGDEAGLIGDTVTEIIMGASNGIPSVDYLNANNALRLYDSDFDNTNTPNRFFGVHNAIFFEGLESKPDPGETAAGIIPSGQTGVSLSVKRRLWLDEEAALQAPEADSCAVLANGDMRNAWASGADTVISNHYLHRFTAADDMDLSSLDYWIGLEYEVVKSGHTTESLTGTWNVAVDNEAPTVLETGILYRFYVTFSYDQGAQESEMVQIMNVQEQGRHWQGVASGSVSESWGFSNYNNFIHDYPSNTNDLGDIRLLFHDADTGDSGVIDYFLSDTPAGYCWCYAPNHNLVKGQTVTITSSSGLFDMTIIVSDVKAERFQINTAAGSGVNPGEDGTFTWDGKYVAREAFDCAVNFKPFFLTSVKGPGGWGMPERATGLNYYYSTSKDAHGMRYKLIECDFTEGIKFHSGAASTFQPYKIWWIDRQTESDVGHDGDFPATIWFYSQSEVVGDNVGGYVTFKDPPQTEDWNTLYGMKSEGWLPIRCKTATIVGSQAFYGNVQIGGDRYNDRILVSVGNHGYDMIPDDNYLEVLSGDGDEIVLLLTFEEQLFIFKRLSLVIASVTAEEDSIIAQVKIGGINSKKQACVTTSGVFWANSFGAFLHNGSDLTRLTTTKIGLSNSHDQIDIQHEDALP